MYSRVNKHDSTKFIFPHSRNVILKIITDVIYKLYNIEKSIIIEREGA